MSMGLAFWILMLVSLVFGGLSWSGSYPWATWGGSLLLFILLVLLGWAQFGPPIR